MGLPVAAIVAIVFGAWALLVLLIFALYQILKSRGICSCECSPCGKDSEAGCSQCCVSLSESCDCDCCKPSTDSCLDNICPRKKEKVSCVDIIFCQCCAGPGEQSCCFECEANDKQCSTCCGPACFFRPCDCGVTPEGMPWTCSDLCCCECNYKSPTWMAHGTPSQQAAALAGTPPREVMRKISMLSQSGYRLQAVGPDGQIRMLDAQLGLSSPPTPPASSRSVPIVGFQPSSMGLPQAYHSSPRLSEPIMDEFTRAHYERMVIDRMRLSSYGRRVSVTEGLGRSLPPIPDSPGPSRESHSERQLRRV